MENNRHYVGDVFEIRSKDYNQKKFVVLVRSIITKEHFYLISFSSFEPWSEKTITIENRFERAWVTIDEIKYLAETDDITFLGNINNYKDLLLPVLKRSKNVA